MTAVSSIRVRTVHGSSFDHLVGNIEHARLNLGDAVPRNPIIGIAACCASAASGHAAAALPRSVMNARRPMQNVI
jgi:hypothetical protein